ncbi:hemagglutinin repeat-containing protein [Orbaceae bacterium ESL0721]|nr:hemagglutinin repeat-containing protein [Orbaceae bacterium ESL0721]
MKSSGFLSSETTISHIEVDNETQKGSYLTGENVTLNAGNNMSVIGSDIIADSALNLTAGGDINIDAAKEIYHHYEQNITKKSGLKVLESLMVVSHQTLSRQIMRRLTVLGALLVSQWGQIMRRLTVAALLAA